MSNESPALDSFPSYIQDNWEKSSYTEWTPIQEKVIPPLLNGENALFHSPTGTGKTVAYLLPSLQKIDESVKQHRF
ncbi:DEAD/DEAH box helicase [Sinobaca sp. H24]|uniref:DEAD/DEAH box helicase n=1 Tax=Sinobaca sp. H24 TaxID=2923376 RepID=UPI00207AF81A|nr:DEAD/DEAH box helicase [Sinobaca sp. H24]